MIEIGKRALRSAGIEAEDVPQSFDEAQDMLDQAHADIDEITAQIAVEDEGGTNRGPDWLGRAIRARSFAYGKKRIAERVLHAFNQQDRRANIEAEKAKVVAAAKARAARPVLAQRWEIAIDCARLKAVREVLKTMPEEQRQPFYDAMSEAEAAFREKVPHWRDMPIDVTQQ